MKTTERIVFKNQGPNVVAIMATPGMVGVVAAAMKRWVAEHGDDAKYGGPEAKEFVAAFDRWTRS